MIRPRPLGHAGGADETLFTVLLGAALVLGWIGISRLRRRGFPRLPKWAAFGTLPLGALVLAMAFVVPPKLAPKLAAARPASQARVEIVSPREGAVLRGAPASVNVQIVLRGGTLVPFTSPDVNSREGHLHLSLDGSLVSMTEGLEQSLEVPEGRHQILVTFVAVDHGPFNPPISASVTFEVEA